MAIEEQIREERARARQKREAALQAEFSRQLEKQQQRESLSLPACPDCGAALVEVKLFVSGAEGDVPVAHITDGEKSPSLYFVRLKAIGGVQTTICTSCHRIFLHGVPLEPTFCLVGVPK